MSMYTSIPFSDVEITDGFWAARQTLNRNVTLECVRAQFEQTGRFAAFRCDWKEGEPNKPHFFWDSDVAKWLESAAYVLKKTPDAKLEAYVESVIDCIENNRDENGYFNIYFTVVEPDKRFTRRMDHELYCAGHLMEAAVAYYEATGKRRFLDMMCQYADYIDRVFRVEQSAAFSTPGHEEIELALVKLYLCTGEKRYLDLCMFFLDMRGTADAREPQEGWSENYCQNHISVREQRTAEGHSVRACYLYCAMADAARLTGDEGLQKACEALFDNIYYKRMYITGGIGSTHDGERFTGDYDLPNAAAYAETCAAISLAMFASRMSLLSARSKYADAVETALYNGIISGLSLDGKSFFYTNPLEIDLSMRKANECRSCYKPITQRVEVFDCSCCPPNITRFMASLGGLVYAQSADTLFVHQYMSSTLKTDGTELTQQTDYPNSGTVHFTVKGFGGKRVAVRIPAWCQRFDMDGAEPEVKDGYAYVTVDTDDFAFTLILEMKPMFYEASPKVAADMGKVALQKGPVVYCLEGVDNDGDLHGLCADIFETPEECVEPSIGVPMLTVNGWRKFACGCCTGALYRPVNGDYRKTKLRFIPYYAFANRGESDMTVWVTKF